MKLIAPLRWIQKLLREERSEEPRKPFVCTGCGRTQAPDENFFFCCNTIDGDPQRRTT